LVFPKSLAERNRPDRFRAITSLRINNAANQQVGTFATRVYRSKLDPRYSQVLEIDNGGQTWQDALVLQLQKRFSHGLQGSVAYTYSHAIDDFEQGGGNNVVFPGVSTYYNGDFKADKGSSGLDQRHRVAVTSLWSPTFA
jgi:hypothetical protein